MGTSVKHCVSLCFSSERGSYLQKCHRLVLKLVV